MEMEDLIKEIEGQMDKIRNELHRKQETFRAGLEHDMESDWFEETAVKELFQMANMKAKIRTLDFCLGHILGLSDGSMGTAAPVDAKKNV